MRGNNRQIEKEAKEIQFIRGQVDKTIDDIGLTWRPLEWNNSLLEYLKINQPAEAWILGQIAGYW